MAHQKFDPAKLERLNDPERLADLPPATIWEALDAPDARDIVDIGAGTGLFAAAFAQLAPDATIHALDAEPTMVEWMRANRPEVAAGRIVPVLVGETSAPLSDASADAAVMINLHHELADPLASYREARRLLRPGGRIVVVDWLPVETPKGPPLAIRVSGETIAAMLTEAGFSEARVEAALPTHSVVTATA